MATVLIYGNDATLVQTRQWVLEHSAFQVETALSLTEVEEVFHTRKIDLVILCHSLSREDCEAALTLIQPHRPGLKVLLLSPDLAHANETESDSVVSSFLAPETLIATIQTLTAKPLRSHSANA